MQSNHNDNMYYGRNLKPPYPIILKCIFFLTKQYSKESKYPFDDIPLFNKMLITFYTNDLN